VLLRFSDSPQPSVAAQIRQRKSPITAALAGVIARIFSGEKRKTTGRALPVVSEV
jgi:hypothetical protein